MSLSPDQRALLLGVARGSIEHGLDRGAALPVEPRDYDPALQELRSCFVTLDKDARLRGCIGSLEARRPLVCDVARQAFAAAFSDPRFPPVERAELPRISIDVSVLSPPQPIVFRDEPDLLRQLRPGRDGLTIERDGHRATFLPSVWRTLPDPADFLHHLKHKAGIPRDRPVRVAERYTTESFGE